MGMQSSIFSIIHETLKNKYVLRTVEGVGVMGHATIDGDGERRLVEQFAIKV